MRGWKPRGYQEMAEEYGKTIQITVNTPWGALGPQEAGSGEVVEGEVVNEIEGATHQRGEGEEK